MPSLVDLSVCSTGWDDKLNPATGNPYTNTERLAICTWSYRQGKLTPTGELIGEADILKAFSKNPDWFFSELQKLRNQTQFTLGDILKSNPRKGRQKACVTQSMKPIKERLRDKYVDRIRHTPLYKRWLMSKIHS